MGNESESTVEAHTKKEIELIPFSDNEDWVFSYSVW